MPKIKLTKSAIDTLKPGSRDKVYWDATLPGFGVKVTPKGRKVFIALYRVRGGKSRLRKYTIGPYGKLTLHHARATAQRVFAERFEGRDPATEKLEQRRRDVADRVDDLVESFAAEHLARIRSGRAVARALRWNLGSKRNAHLTGSISAMGQNLSSERTVLTVRYSSKADSTYAPTRMSAFDPHDPLLRPRASLPRSASTLRSMQRSSERASTRWPDGSGETAFVGRIHLIVNKHMQKL